MRSANSKLRKFLGLRSSERLLLFKSALMLMAVRVGLKLMPFAKLNGLLARASRMPRRSRGRNSFTPDQLVRSINIAGSYIPGAGKCLPRALAAQLLLARHGHPATVHIGVSRGEEKPLNAHAWLEVEGKVVIGGPGLDSYTHLLEIEREVQLAYSVPETQYPLFNKRQLDLKWMATFFLCLARFVASPAGAEYGITRPAKLKLAVRIIRNQKHFEQGHKVRVHLALVEQIFKIPKSMDGDVVECGCWNGNSTTSLSLACSLVGRRLFVCDSFEGLPEPRADEKYELSAFYKDHYYVWEKGVCSAEGGFDSVRRTLERYGAIEVCTFVPGYFKDTLKTLETESLVLIYEAAVLRSSVEDCVRNLWPKLQEGCCFFCQEPDSVKVVGLFYDERWWKDNLNATPPGFFGSGYGPRMALGNIFLGYSKKIDTKKILEEGNRIVFAD